jgi:cyclopropane fatty-acyl-phospholipid synthase-like methyltransferase
MPSEIARDYFEFIAKLGMTKHYGSMQATRELAELCHVGSGHYVLDVGCGVGATPVYLAKTARCQVVGVDLLQRMIEQSRERAGGAGAWDIVLRRVMRGSIRGRRVRGLTDEGADRGGMFMTTEE